jgi:DNA-binding beta-propeller fold protein YncE
MIVGAGDYRYEVIEGWGLGSEGRDPGGQTAHIAVDSQGRVYVSRYAEGTREILAYWPDGRFIRSIGRGIFAETHFIGIDAEDNLYCADPANHTVRKFTPAGDLLMTLGTIGELGAPGMPFNQPSKAVVTPGGDIFVADGYGQNRVHRFSPAGELLFSWGEWGTKPGQFNQPHGIELDRWGRVLVADRWNNRVQAFDHSGKHLMTWTSDLWTPHDVCVGQGEVAFVVDRDVLEGRVSVFDYEGQLLCRWDVQDTDGGQLTGLLHGMCEDRAGDLYVTDVTGVKKLRRL